MTDAAGACYPLSLFLPLPLPLPLPLCGHCQVALCLCRPGPAEQCGGITTPGTGTCRHMEGGAGGQQQMDLKSDFSMQGTVQTACLCLKLT